jgi:hypothetical protein
MLIMGTKVKEKVLSQGQFFCPTCTVTRNYKLKQLSNYFTFFFIPLFRIKNLGERFECQVCGNAFKPEVLTPENQRMMQLEATTRQALLAGASAADIRAKLIASGAKEEEVDKIIGMAKI